MSGKLTRTNDDRMIGGVCSGLARYFKIDPVLVRLAFVTSVVTGRFSFFHKAKPPSMRLTFGKFQYFRVQYTRVT